MDPNLTRLAASVAASDSLESLTRPLLEMLESVTGMESVYLTRVDETRGVQDVLFSRNARQLIIPEGLTVPWDDTLCKRALQEQRPYSDDVAECWGESDAARQLGIRTYVSQPIRYVDGSLYGTLCAASAVRVPLASDTLSVLTMFARLIAHQVERERSLQRLRYLAQQLGTGEFEDPLTGLLNRRGLCMALDRRLVEARSTHQVLQLATVAFDGFDAINDRHGHDAADRLMLHQGHRLKTLLQPGDMLARDGVDTFTFVTAYASTDLQSRLKHLVAGRISEDLADESVRANVSIVVSRPSDGADDFLSRADAAMAAIRGLRTRQRAT